MSTRDPIGSVIQPRRFDVLPNEGRFQLVPILQEFSNDDDRFVAATCVNKLIIFQGAEGFHLEYHEESYRVGSRTGSK